jgi:hypothetical protein
VELRRQVHDQFSICRLTRQVFIFVVKGAVWHSIVFRVRVEFFAPALIPMWSCGSWLEPHMLGVPDTMYQVNAALSQHMVAIAAEHDKIQKMFSYRQRSTRIVYDMTPSVVKDRPPG